MKTNSLFLFLTIVLLFMVFFFTNCTKIPNHLTDETIPIVSTNDVTEVTSSSAISGGLISSDGGSIVIERGVCWSTNQSPTIMDTKTTDGQGAGSFISSITGLTVNSTYYLRAYATNKNGTGYGSVMSFKTLDENATTIVFNPNITYGSVTDIDGNTYKTVTIGTQTWMAENLKVTKYNDGTNIMNVIDPTAWGKLTTGAYASYNNSNNIDTINTYGRLYNWYAVNTGKLCPVGWHIPSDQEWGILENYLIVNGYNYDGTISGNKIAKAMASSRGWRVYNSTNGNGVVGNSDYPEKQNASGFTALPSGCRLYDGTFSDVGFYGCWWSLTGYDASNAYYRYMGYLYSDFSRAYYDKRYGFSVRCVKN